MDAIVENCCGLDVHQKTVVACVIITGERRRAKREVRTFRTVMKDLLALRDWLASLGVTHVGMESTGVYWVPVFRVLEGRFELVVGNATHIKNVPGRKTAKLRPAAGDPRAARPDALSPQTRPGPITRAESDPEAARDREHQAQERRLGRLWRVGSRDAARDRRRRR